MKISRLNKLFGFSLLFSASISAAELSGGDVVGRHIYGLANDYQGDPVMIDERPLIHSSSQFNQITSFGESKFLISGFSDTIGSIFVTSIDKKAEKYIDTEALSLTSIEGISNPSEGKSTPWGSVIFTENERIDAANPKNFIQEFAPFYKHKPELVKPYKYGWVSEVIVLDEKGQAKAIKNYALGRLFADQVLIMPDAKTVYMLDKLGNLYLFIAEEANSLAKGKLYALSQEQNKIKYSLLGKPSALKVKFKLKKAKFKSIFHSATPKNGQCKRKYTLVNTVYGEECLKINKKYKKYAAYFEPIRYMALKGINRFTKKDQKLIFDAEKNQLILTHNNSLAATLSLSNNEEFKSQYIIKEQI